MEIDALFIEGIAAVASALIVFCGSIMLVLSFVMGARLAYFVTASVTLAFVFMMAIVWSFTPLGPVGQLPSWKDIGVGATAQESGFQPASSYPESPWRPPNQADQEELTKVSELEAEATDVLEAELKKGAIGGVSNISDVAVNTDGTRLLQQGDTEYGAVSFAPPQGDEPVAIVVMRYDPGNPLGMGRMIATGTFVLLVAHLFMLNRSEKSAKRLATAPRG